MLLLTGLLLRQNQCFTGDFLVISPQMGENMHNRNAKS